MNKIKINYPGPSSQLAGRELLGSDIEIFHDNVIKYFSDSNTEWELNIDSNLLFDIPGINLILLTLNKISKNINQVKFRIVLDEATYKNFYSIQSDEQIINLPLVAKRKIRSNQDTKHYDCDIILPIVGTKINFPLGLHKPEDIVTPTALLLPFTNCFDLLFANQIAVISEIKFKASKDPKAILKALLKKFMGDRTRLEELAGLSFCKVHPTARVHKTAILEGAIVGPHAKIGAHTTVRFSYIGANAVLHDGAKAEYSVVGEGSWLMHDLVLYRAHVESQVFLIHGPYQFSSFHKRSGAFATIMMDYRPDEGDIKVVTNNGVRSYKGKFLGSILEEGAKTLGGSLIAPGRTIPSDTWLGVDAGSIHTLRTDKEISKKIVLGPGY